MTEYEKLKRIVDEIDSLLSSDVSWLSPEVRAWHNKATRWLINHFGEDSYEYTNFKQIQFQASFAFDASQEIKACSRGLNQAKAILNTYLEDLEENAASEETEPSFNGSRVFIVHGHDGELKHNVARIIEKQGIEAVILSEQANRGRTIIEKIEDYSDVGGAICLFTADDIGKEKDKAEDNLRARQNVVLETGYFIGKLGRNRIIILADNGIEMPSDLSGVVYTNTTSWQFDLLKELKEMGYSIDLNRLF